MDNLAKLRADLAELNLKCQQARDNEIRFGLQRSRLEAERATLLARIVEAVAPPPISAAPYAVTWQSLPVSPEATAPTLKPVIPAVPSRLTISVMIQEALQNAPNGLLPRQVVEALRARGCQSRSSMIYRAASRMIQAGRLGRSDGRSAAIMLMQSRRRARSVTVCQGEENTKWQPNYTRS